jgi:TolB-like protein/pimeloyl-ACP methyl ester carboxylesterase/predicted Ser/Thr protein kinase
MEQIEQEIHFCTTADGVRIAYATAGQGPPLVKAANWLNHLEFDWRSPIWNHMLQEFTRDHLLVRYDERGNGLSDWNVDELTFEAFVNDLEAVVDAVGLTRFPILGISQGGPVAIAYAVRHPERVSHLVLYGSYARGWDKRGSPMDEIERRQAYLTLTKLGWGKDHPAFRQLWTSLFVPDGTLEQWHWFNDLQRESASPDNAFRILNEVGTIDVVDLLPQLKVPTLVLHCRDDAVAPFEEGRLLASLIPDSRFIPLEGRNHLLLESDPAWPRFVSEVRRFLGSSTPPMSSKPAASQLSSLEGKHIRVGNRLGRYKIKSLLGAGGMGQVYLAEDSQLRRSVALKVLPGELASNADRMRRFVQEAQAAAALNHPNIAHIYEIGETDGVNFIAMEFIDGETLRHKIHRDQTPLSKLLKYLNQVAQGLAKAHQAGVIHRDLKPDNIMITRDDYAKVLDFGLAKLVEPQGSFGSGDRGSSEIATAIMQQQSMPGTVLGTIGYMSPEQASGRVHEIDHRSDIFSFGCILFEAATGQRAFEGKDALDSLHKIVHAPTPQLKGVNPLAPDDLQRVVRRCLAKEPEKRYQSMKEVAIELDDLQQELKGFTESQYSGQPAPAPNVSTSGMTPTDEGFRIAVLPFKFRDADPAVEVLADGLTEEIGTGLSRFRYLSVVTSTSAARPKGEIENEQAPDAKPDTRYVLEGSIRKGGSAIRVSAQLVDTETGAQLWSETYNRAPQTSTIFAVQDDVAGRVVATVADSYGVLVHSMRAAIRKKDDADLTPVEWQFQYFAYREQITPSSHAALKGRLHRVAERNEGQSDLWACLAQIYVDEYAFGFEDDATSLDRALAAGRRAVELDRSNQFALVALAQVHFFRQDLAAFGPAAERAMALNPLNTDALGILGLQIVHTGEFERGTAIVRRAMALNPNHAGWMHFAPLWDHFHKGEYEQALECANRVDVPGLFWPFLVMASACGHLGRRAEAQAAVRDLLALDPEFAAHVRSNVATWHFASGLMDPLLEGLRKAGLEISDEEPAPASSAPSLASSETRADEGFWVAVLPFKFTGSNTDVATLAEGLSEEIVTGLSRFSYLRVISRSSTLRYAKETDDVRDVGKTLGARYVIEGSLRVAGSSLRISVQLVDAGTGAHLWAETYDRQFRAEEVFALQDDLVPRIVSTVADVNGVLPRSMSEVVCGKNPDELSPYEAVLRSFRYFDRVSAEELGAARSCLEIAVQKAPANADAWAMLALLFVQDYGQGFNLHPDALNSGVMAAQRAVEAGPSNHLAHFSLAQARFFQKELQGFRNAAERAVALNPMDANALAFVGELFTYVGDSERGLALASRAKEINPNHPGWFWYADFFHAYRQGDYRGALDLILKTNLPGHWGMHAGIAAVAGQLGDYETAGKAVRDLLKLRPDYGATVHNSLAKWFDPELCEQLLDGLRKAGLRIAGEEEGSLRTLRIGKLY